MLAMKSRLLAAFLIIVAIPLSGGAGRASAATPLTAPAKISLDEAGALVVDGKKVFPITLTIVPGPDAKAPSGKHAYEEFADGGVMFMRTGKADWNAQT